MWIYFTLKWKFAKKYLFLWICVQWSTNVTHLGSIHSVLHIKEIATTSELIRIYRWNQLLQRVKTEYFFTLCSINLNVASISGMGNVQLVFNLDPCVMKHLWCDIREFSDPSRSLNGWHSSDVIDARVNRSHSSYVNQISGAVITRRLTSSLFSLTAGGQGYGLA